MKEDSENASPSSKRFFGVFLLVLLLGGLAVGAFFLYGQSKSDEEFRVECEQLANGELWEELKLVAADWAESSGNRGEALIYLAEAQLQSGDARSAVESLLSIPARSERSYAALITACDLQFGPVNDPLAGVETLKLMAQQKPSSITTRQRLIFFYAVTLQRESMLEAIYAAIEDRADPLDAYTYLMVADHLSFTNGFEKNTEWLQSDLESELFQVGRVVQLMRNLEASTNPAAATRMESILTQFTDLRKKYPQNLILLEEALARAIESYDVQEVERLVSEMPDGVADSVLLRYRGWLEFQQGEFEVALESLEQSIAQFPLDWHTWHEVSACRRRLGDTDGAAEAAEIALMGKAIRKEVMQLADARSMSPDLLKRIANYAKLCGDWRVESGAMSKLAPGSYN